MRIGIIGAGKVGTVLGQALRKKGFDVAAVGSRRQASLDTARAYIGPDSRYTLDIMEVVRLADVIGVTTQDREIGNVARTIAGRGERLDGKVFFHTSGAHPAAELLPLSGCGAFLGSLHPLQTFPDIDAAIAVLPDTPIFIEGDERALPVLRTIADAVGLESHRIASENKVLYHLSAVFVCNLLTALLYAGQGVMQRVGIDLKPFYPIIRATLKNIENRGPLPSLTGPVVRGDAGTVASHIGAMEGMDLHGHVYKALSLVALAMAEERGTLTDEQRMALKRLLGV
jgi:predicted short-subunit dehydrogenase-like oxidoreductase (DUF2520 family)